MSPRAQCEGLVGDSPVSRRCGERYIGVTESLRSSCLLHRYSAELRANVVRHIHVEPMWLQIGAHEQTRWFDKRKLRNPP
jgi:hypothetical protein